MYFFKLELEIWYTFSFSYIANLIQKNHKNTVVSNKKNIFFSTTRGHPEL